MKLHYNQKSNTWSCCLPEILPQHYQQPNAKACEFDNLIQLPNKAVTKERVVFIVEVAALDGANRIIEAITEYPGLAVLRGVFRIETQEIVPATLLHYVEQEWGLIPREVALVLGITKSMYSAYKNGKRDIPKYIQNSIDAHIRLNSSTRRKALIDRQNNLTLDCSGVTV